MKYEEPNLPISKAALQTVGHRGREGARKKGSGGSGVFIFWGPLGWRHFHLGGTQL